METPKRWLDCSDNITGAQRRPVRKLTSLKESADGSAPTNGERHLRATRKRRGSGAAGEERLSSGTWETKCIRHRHLRSLSEGARRSISTSLSRQCHVAIAYRILSRSPAAGQRRRYDRRRRRSSLFLVPQSLGRRWSVCGQWVSVTYCPVNRG